MPPMSDVITQALKEYIPEDGSNPFATWAGECGMFVDVACQIADEWSVRYEIGNAYAGKLEGGFEVLSPPGLTMAEVESFGIIRNLNHIWLVHEGQHFDGSCANGVSSFFEYMGVINGLRAGAVVADHVKRDETLSFGI